MRIIGGSLKGRVIRVPDGLQLRPTTDFAKESLFNILSNRIDFDRLTVLDLFAGTGAIALELASRGASQVTAVDANVKCLAFIRQVASSFSLPIQTVRDDVFKFISSSQRSYQFIFCDPPYDLKDLALLPIQIIERNLLEPGGWLVVEHGPKTDLSGCSGFREKRKYGNVNFSFFSAEKN